MLLEILLPRTVLGSHFLRYAREVLMHRVRAQILPLYCHRCTSRQISQAGCLLRCEVHVFLSGPLCRKELERAHVCVVDVESKEQHKTCGGPCEVRGKDVHFFGNQVACYKDVYFCVETGRMHICGEFCVKWAVSVDYMAVCSITGACVSSKNQDARQFNSKSGNPGHIQLLKIPDESCVGFEATSVYGSTGAESSDPDAQEQKAPQVKKSARHSHVKRAIAHQAHLSRGGLWSNLPDNMSTRYARNCAQWTPNPLDHRQQRLIAQNPRFGGWIQILCNAKTFKEAHRVLLDVRKNNSTIYGHSEYYIRYICIVCFLNFCPEIRLWLDAVRSVENRRLLAEALSRNNGPLLDCMRIYEMLLGDSKVFDVHIIPLVPEEVQWVTQNVAQKVYKLWRIICTETESGRRFQDAFPINSFVNPVIRLLSNGLTLFEKQIIVREDTTQHFFVEQSVYRFISFVDRYQKRCNCTIASSLGSDGVEKAFLVRPKSEDVVIRNICFAIRRAIEFEDMSWDRFCGRSLYNQVSPSDVKKMHVTIKNIKPVSLSEDMFSTP